MNDYGMILFARPSFIEGLSRIIDVGGTLNEYNMSTSTEEADYNAIMADWQAVGDAIRKAAGQYATDSKSTNQEE